MTKISICPMAYRQKKHTILKRMRMFSLHIHTYADDDNVAILSGNYVQDLKSKGFAVDSTHNFKDLRGDRRELVMNRPY